MIDMIGFYFLQGLLGLVILFSVFALGGVVLVVCWILEGIQKFFKGVSK